MCLFEGNQAFSFKLTGSEVSFFLIFLRGIIGFLCLFSSSSALMRKRMRKTIGFLVLFLFLYFSSSDPLFFYIFFELSILPAFFLIFSWGKTPERIGALSYIIVYTLIGSFPLLFSLLLRIEQIGKIQGILNFSVVSKKRSLECSFFILAFLIKLPLFGLHSWLPKAHVEAPTVGSMILAALLLKLGGFGLYRLALYKSFHPPQVTLILLGWIVSSIFLVSFLCFRIPDMKSVIAFSSVSHMLLVAFRWFWFSTKGLVYSLLLRVSHGFVRSGLFLLVGRLYEISGSRKVLLNTKFHHYVSLLNIFFFCLICANCSAPPRLSLFAEIVLCSHLVLKIGVRHLSIFLFVLLSGLYCLFLYRKCFHGKARFKVSIPCEENSVSLRLFSHRVFTFFFIFFLFCLI